VERRSSLLTGFGGSGLGGSGLGGSGLGLQGGRSGFDPLGDLAGLRAALGDRNVSTFTV
jgi:hypothetical protein